VGRHAPLLLKISFFLLIKIQKKEVTPPRGLLIWLFGHQNRKKMVTPPCFLKISFFGHKIEKKAGTPPLL
jgi:hypothetical protein